MVPPLRLQSHCFHHFFSYPNFMTGFQMVFLQSSQRKTAEATKPNSSFVFYINLQHTLVSKIRFTILLLSASNFSFILER
jgi:hypothetical protein